MANVPGDNIEIKGLELPESIDCDKMVDGILSGTDNNLYHKF